MSVGRLTEDEAADRLRALAGWQIENGKLKRAFKFDDFMGAVEFVNKLAPIAEAAGHHPDLQVGWGRVVVELTSHDAGGLTAKDFQLAAKIDQL